MIDGLKKFFPTPKGVNWGENESRYQSVSLDLARISTPPPTCLSSSKLSQTILSQLNGLLEGSFGLFSASLALTFNSHFIKNKCFFYKNSTSCFYIMGKYGLSTSSIQCDNEDAKLSPTVSVGEFRKCWNYGLGRILLKVSKRKSKLELGPMKVTSRRATIGVTASVRMCIGIRFGKHA